jgi:hypothetical protein
MDAKRFAKFRENAERAGRLTGVHVVSSCGWEAVAVRLMDEIDRLQAIVDKLPETKDGVHVVPGISEVWVIVGFLGPKRSCNWSGTTHVLFGGDFGYHIKPDSFPVTECYSTLEALEAAVSARKKKDE